MGGMLLHSNGLIHLIINKQAWSKLPSTNAIIDVSAVFFNIVRGGDQTHVQNIVANILLFLRAFLQREIDMKDFLRAKMSQIEGKIL